MKTTSPPCPTCPKYNPREAIHTAPGHLKLPNDHSRAGEWVSYDFFCLLDRSVFSHSLCFHTGLESSLADRLLPLLLLKPFQKRLSLPGASSQTRGLLSDQGPPLRLYSGGGAPFPGQVLGQVRVVQLVLHPASVLWFNRQC